jgi:uroporphyrinogen decarboxylase
MMRQAGRYLPEYRELRSRHSFDVAVRTPAIAAEITLQPLRRFPLDAAIVFADIMTPLAAMGVPIEFDPGPKLVPHTIGKIATLGDLHVDQVGHVAETIGLVRDKLDPEVVMIGFAGGPVTLLAYLVEGGGSQHFPNFRLAFHTGDPTEALMVLARAMSTYLEAQIEAGANVVQLFDTCDSRSQGGSGRARRASHLFRPGGHPSLGAAPRDRGRRLWSRLAASYR